MSARGYTLVDNDGETLYCRSDLKTGSHVQKTTTCLTGPELDALHDQIGQGLQSIDRYRLPLTSDIKSRNGHDAWLPGHKAA